MKNKKQKAPKYKVVLTHKEREYLTDLIKKGKAAAKKIMHARVLLKADEGKEGSSWKDSQISEALEITVRTVERTRKRLVTEGLESAITRKKSPTTRKKVDGDVEAHLIALSCGEVPEGRAKWTLRLLADKMVELEYIDSISHETVRKTLKKTT